MLTEKALGYLNYNKEDEFNANHLTITHASLGVSPFQEPRALEDKSNKKDLPSSDGYFPLPTLPEAKGKKKKRPGFLFCHGGWRINEIEMTISINQ